MKKVIKMNELDTVATALEDIYSGEEVEIIMDNINKRVIIKALENIPYGNKIALTNIIKGDKIRKYGEDVGVSIRDINLGQLVHVHNVKSLNLDIPTSIIEEIKRQMNIK